MAKDSLSILYNAKNVVGWGNCPNFDKSYRFVPWRITHFIDGVVSGGYTSGDLRLPIQPPEMLRRLNASDTLIIVYAEGSFEEIKLIAKSFGDFEVIKESHYRWVRWINYLDNNLAAADTAQKVKDSAIVVQGSLESLANIFLLRLLKRLNPTSHIILSTWEDSEYLVAASSEIDELVVSSRPPSRGPSNINLQIKSTLAGLKAAHYSGYRSVCKVRTDFISCRHSVIEFTYRTTGLCRSSPTLICLDVYTRAFIPFHPSDFFMIGNTEQMLAYWDTELIAHDRQNFDLNYITLSLYEISCIDVIPECYLGRSFSRNFGYRGDEGILDGWLFLAKHFDLVATDTMSIIWLKKSGYFKACELHIADRCLLPSELTEIRWGEIPAELKSLAHLPDTLSWKYFIRQSGRHSSDPRLLI